MYRRLLLAALTSALLVAPAFADDDCLAEQLIQAPDTDPQVPGEHVPQVIAFLDALAALADDPPDPDDDPPHELCVPGTGGPIKITHTATNTFPWPTLDPDNGIYGFGGTVDEAGATSIDDGARFLELYGTPERVTSLREQLTHDQLMALLSLWPAPPSPFDEILEYDIRVVNIDISDFPWIEVRFKVFQYDVAPPSFANRADTMGPNIRIEERIPNVDEFEEVAEYDDPRFTPQCVEDVPVIMGIALDTSGSMADFVQTDVLPNSQAYVNWIMGFSGEQIDTTIDPPRETENAISFFAFSGDTDSAWPRAPGDGHDAPAGTGQFSTRTEKDAFQTEYDEMADEVGTGSSPIFAGMREELSRLIAHGATCEPTKMLVTMSDFFDYPFDEGRKQELIDLAKVNQVFMANLLIGDPDTINNPPEEYPGGRPIANDLAAEGRGVVIQNAFENARKAFFDLHMGAARSYCIRYKSRYPFRWNDRVELRLTLPGPASGNEWAESTASAQYPLPILVPEDTPLASIFIPVPEYFYGRFGDLGGELGIQGKLHLERELEGAPARVVTPDSPLDLDFAGGGLGPFAAPASPYGTSGLIVGFANHGYTSLTPTSQESLDNALRVPTSRIPEDSPISEATHYVARLQVFKQPSGGGSIPESCKETVEAIVAVQDRTPPAVFVRLRPSQGQEPSTVQIYEHRRDPSDALDGGDVDRPLDADPWPLADAAEWWQDYDQNDGDGSNDQVTYEGTRIFGHGKKRALIRTAWAGAPQQDHTEKFWAEPPTAEGEYPDADSDGFPDPATANNDVAAFEPTAGGIQVPADVRVEVIVRARDNFAGLSRLNPTYLSGAGEKIWTDPGFEAADETDPPLHARFDPNAAEFQMEDHESPDSTRGPGLVDLYPGRNVAPPYLPVLLRQELEADPTRAGVCWWIESVVKPDRFAGGDAVDERIDNVEFFQYGQSDTQEENEEPDVAEAVMMGANSLRKLHVWARDEHGNTTRFEIPIRIMASDFKATSIMSTGGRR